MTAHFSTQVSDLAIGTIELHPKLKMRTSYEEDIDDLAASIRRHGQEQPGRAVVKADGNGYILYIGMRRYAAFKRLHDEATTEKDRERFGKFSAFVDSGLTDEEMLLRALDENRTGTRKDLTPLEESAVMKQFDLSKSKLPAYLARVYALKVTPEQAANLQKIEQRTKFTFSLEALEYLGGIGKEGEMYKTAGEMASKRYYGRTMEKANEYMDEVAGQKWFRELFPQLCPPEPQPGAAGEGGTGDDNSDELDEMKRIHDELKGGAGSGVVGGGAPVAGPDSPKPEGPNEGEGAVPPAPPPQPAPEYKDGVLRFECPHCGGPCGIVLKPIVFEGDTVSFLHGSPVPFEMEKVAGDGKAECESCAEQYHFQVKRDDEGRYYVETSKAARDPLPGVKKLNKPERLVWVDANGCWGTMNEEGAMVQLFQIKQAKPKDDSAKGKKGGDEK